MFFFVISDNLEMITDRNGTYTWATTQAEALNNMDPNTGISPLELFMRGGYSTSDTYDGRAEYSLEALNYANSKGNKKVAYLLYPGTYYDSTFRQNDAYMMTEASKAQSAGSVFNTISISYSPSAELDNFVQMLNGKQYSGNETTIMEAISEDLSKRIEYSYGNVDTTDSDGDGLYDVWEIRGMRAANGWVVHSDPYLRDSDGDGYWDNEEVGKRDYETRGFQVISDPSDPESTPHMSWPIYIIGWSYNWKTVRNFEFSHFSTYPFLDLKGETNSEWTDDVWREFEKTDGFSRAAQTKRIDLISTGVDPRQIIIRRIDGDLGSECDNLLQPIWNNEWSKYECIQELHLFTHGYEGHPWMYHTDDCSYIEVPELYMKLSWAEDGKAFFHGCHTAQIHSPSAAEMKYFKFYSPYYPLDVFAKYQGVETYGNEYGTSLSSDPYIHMDIITNPSQRVYLRTYHDTPDVPGDSNLLYVPMKKFPISNN